MKKSLLIAASVVLLLLSSVAFSQDKRRTEKFSFSSSETGFLVGQCGTFDVLSDWTFLLTGTDLYDKSGQLVKEGYHYRVIGASLYYNSENPAKEVFGGPAEHENVRYDPATGVYYGSGPSFKIRIPGYGLIFAETGRWGFDENTGQYVFNSGHNQFVDKDLAALCNYLK
jgi:opacity protein-like surface antigen